MKNDPLKLKAYNLIKEKIISCEYAPSSYINEEQIGESISVSRTPIRDALSRLEQEGLITIMPKKGIVVSPLSVNDINMIFEVRSMYEPYALEHYGHVLDGTRLLGFFEAVSKTALKNDPENHQEFFKLDDDLHAFIMSAVPNRFLHQTYDLIQNQNLRFRVMTGARIEKRLNDTCEEHLDILKACLQGDWILAADTMREHLKKSRASTFDMMLASWR